MRPRPPSKSMSTSRESISCASPFELLLHFNQLDCLFARPLNHEGPRVAELVRLLEKFHSFASQLGGPGIQISYAECKMIREMPACAHQRRIVLIHVRGKSDVVKRYCGCGTTRGAFSFQRRPTRLRTRYFAIGLGVLRSPPALRRVEVLLIPELVAIGIFPVHVHVIEALRRHVALVLNGCAIKGLKVCKTGSARGLYPLRLGLFKLRLGSPERPSGSRQSIAAHENSRPVLAGVERQQRHARLLIARHVLTHVHHVPAKMPDGRLRRYWRWCVHLIEQDVDLSGLQGREASPGRFRSAGKRFYVEIDCRVRVHRVQVKMMEPWRGQSLAIVLSLDHGREGHSGNRRQKDRCEFHRIFSLRNQAFKNARISATVWSGVVSCKECPPGRPLPVAFAARSFQVARTSYILPMAPLAAQRASSGHSTLRVKSASSCSRSMDAAAR